MKHAKGPWTVAHTDTGSTKILNANGGVVALMKASGGFKEGNATLVAQAPRLLQALIRLEEEVVIPAGYHDQKLEDARKEALEVIAAATGKTIGGI